jgi:hypothetical protein
MAMYATTARSRAPPSCSLIPWSIPYFTRNGPASTVAVHNTTRRLATTT